MTSFRARIRFRKDGDRRFLSHHDLMRLFERMMRRAGLPFRMTEGFHPLPRMQFASALSLGIIGHEEVLEAEFTEQLDTALLHDGLAQQAPQGISLLSVKTIPVKLTGHACEAEYFLPLPPDQYLDLADKLQTLLHQEQIWSERPKPGTTSRTTTEPEGEERLDQLPSTKQSPSNQVKRVEIRPFVKQLERDARGLHMTFKITPNGSARPEEVLRLLGLDHIVQDGDGVLERTRLVLEDEIQTPPLHHSPENGCSSITWGSSPELPSHAAAETPRETEPFLVRESDLGETPTSS